MGIFSKRHTSFEILLTEHLDGVISASDSAKLTQHLTTCEDCAGNLREQSATQALLRALPLLPIPRSFALPYAPMVTEVSEPNTATRLLRSVQLGAAAAIILVALVGLNVMQTSPTNVTLQSTWNSSAPMARSIEVADAGSEHAASMASTSAEVSPGSEFEPSPNLSASATKVLAHQDLQEVENDVSSPYGEFAPETNFSSNEARAQGRTITVWVSLATGLVTTLLAIAAVAFIWRSNRPV